MQQKRLFTILLFLGFFFSAQTVFADTVIHLPVTPIAQRFSPADTNGDDGTNNCMAAALTTALLILSDSGNLSLKRERITYADIRWLLRSWAPDTRKGISPEVLEAGARTITKREYTLTTQHVSPAAWVPFLRQELSQSHPVIVHMSDRNALYNPESQAVASHVIVVYGLDEETVSFTDSWDGGFHSVSHDVFANAWGKGYYSWLAFVFTLQNS